MIFLSLLANQRNPSDARCNALASSWLDIDNEGELMRAVGYATTGNLDVLEEVALAESMPGSGEVRVRIVLSGVNPTDWKSRNGRIHMPIPLGRHQISGLDGAGIVDVVGDHVESLVVGQRVWVQLVAFKRLDGTLQESVVLPQELVSPLPDSASFELGAALGVPFVTAHRALTVRAGGPTRLAPGALRGTVVLAAGGAGAVGNATIQLARWAGATVLATVSDADKGLLAKAAGAHHVVNYREAGADRELRRLCPDGVDIIVEVAPTQNADLDISSAAVGATIVVYADNGGDTLTLPVRANMAKNLAWHFILLYSFPREAWLTGAAAIGDALRDGALRVGIDAGLPVRHFPFRDVAAAHAAVQAGAIGKVVVDVQPQEHER